MANDLFKAKRLPGELKARVAQAIMDVISAVPKTKQKKSDDPEKEAYKLIHHISIKAAGISASMALPSGLAGFLTILPDLALIWEIQAKLVSDIAGLYGKQATMTREQMFYCLFRHSAAHAFRGIIIEEVGSRILVRKASLKIMQKIAKKIGIRISQRALGKGISRFIPLVGPLGIGIYAYFDTLHVGNNAIGFFKKDIEISDELEIADPK